MSFAEKVKTVRGQLKLSQEKLAAKLGVSFSTVNRWESGLYAPTIKAKRKLAPLFEKYNIVLEEKEDGKENE